MAGTSLPKAYEYSWNDEFIAMNEFAYALTDAVAAMARGLDTRVEGIPLVVYNPLSQARTDLVEAMLPASLQDAPSVAAVDGSGHVLPTQLTVGADASRRVLFPATVPGFGFSVFGLKAATPPTADTELKVTERGIANARYRLTLDNAGDISSLIDIEAGRELLAAPLRLAFLTEWPLQFPAWNMDWVDRKQPPRSYLTGSPKVEVVEAGPLRVALRVEREGEGSWFTQTIRLSAGPTGERVEFLNQIDWKSQQCSLKATFPLRIHNPKATYTWDLGTIERGNNNPSQYEVPTHGWVDLTDTKGDYGVTLLTGAKYGSDKPTDDTLRLTLLYTPAAPDDFHEQRNQDWGRHDITFGLVGHQGDWRAGKATWQARRFEQPLLAFAVPKHGGRLGKTFSLLTVSNDQVAIQAIKRAEGGQGIVVRLQELLGKPARTRLQAATAIEAAWEMNGVEAKIAALEPEGGSLRLDFLPYQLRTVALSLAPGERVGTPSTVPLELNFDLDAMSSNANYGDGDCNGEAETYPAEMLPDTLTVGGVVFRLGSRADGAKNALVADGQVISLPAGYQRVYLLAASVRGRVKDLLVLGDISVPFEVADWSGFVGQWDNRVFEGRVPAQAFSVRNELLRVAPAYLHNDRLAWSASHRHRAQAGDLPYSYGYMFSYAIALPAKVTTLTLPRDAGLRIFAITVAKDDNSGAVPLVPLWPGLARDASFHLHFDTP